MMRIALVLSYYPTELRPHSGMQFYEEARALAKLADLGVFVLSPVYPKSRLLRPRRFAHRANDRPKPLSGVRVHHVSYPALPMVSRLFNGSACGKSLVPHLRDFRPDVVLAYQVYPEGYGAVYAAEQLGLPSVVGAIGSDLRRSGRIVRPLVKRALHRSSFVLTVCGELTERAIRMGLPSSKVATILNGCDPEVFYLRDRTAARTELGIAPDCRLVVFTGNLVKVKGLPDLIRAISILHGLGVDVDATLIGSGPLERPLRDLSRALGVEHRIRFTGSLPPAQVAKWLGAANVFCLPSHSEGSPNAMVEALRSGRPAVASDVGGIPELLSEASGILAPPSHPPALARALQEALTRDWNEPAISRLYRRTWDDMAHETFNVCLQVLNGPDAHQPVHADVEQYDKLNAT